jgi:hypothetical protein
MSRFFINPYSNLLRQGHIVLITMKARSMALAARGVYLLYILFEAARLSDAAVLHAAVFLATLPIVFFAKRKPLLWYHDLAVVVLFLVAGAAGLLSVALKPTVFGPDKVLHLLGGAVLGSLFYVLIPKQQPAYLTALYAFALATMVATGWELFEWAYYHLLAPRHLTELIYTDTILDLAAGMLGMALAVVVHLKAELK